jgi:CheY-like chemotaxis protein
MVAEESGCAKKIVVMQNAREAVRYLSGAGQQYPLPELIFLDINMPAMDGWEFIKKYEELPVAQQERAVIIMLTTSFNPEDELKAMAIPAITGFRNKPLTAKMLDDILQQYF